jgi:hypothetical protein
VQLTALLQPRDTRSRQEFDVVAIKGRKTMQRILSLLALGVCANALVSLSASAQAAPQVAPEVTLTRLDCGSSATPTDAGPRFSDTYAYDGVKVQLVFSCFSSSMATTTWCGTAASR